MSRLLITNSVGGGTFRIRGEQFGEVLGCTVRVDAPRACIERHDVVVAVKHLQPELVRRLQASGTPWIWDVADAYPQDTRSSRRAAVAWFTARLAELRPTAVIYPNQQMLADCLDSRPSIVIPHHFRPGLATRPLSPELRVVGYEGMDRYIAPWRERIERACSAAGCTFVTGRHALRQADVAISLRAPPWDGYQMRWKPAVKRANAHACGLPFLGDEPWADYVIAKPEDLVNAIEWARSSGVRERIHTHGPSLPPTVEQCARALRDFATEVACR
jgi:hypothetical protein